MSANDEHDVRYRSSTTARTDAHGGVVLRGNRAMRLLWSLQPSTGAPYALIPKQFPLRIDVVAQVARRVAHATLTRGFASPSVRARELRPAKDGVYGTLYSPASPRSSAAVLLFGGSEGGESGRLTAELLASHGYTSLALAYFDEPGLPHDLHDIPIEYFARALHILGRQPGVDRGKLAVYGVSRGGEAAQLVGLHYPRLVHAVISLVGANGAACGIPAYHGQIVRCLGAAWTFRGRPVPYSYFSATTSVPFHDELIDGPIFLVCDGVDEFGPSCGMAFAIRDRLRAHHFPYRVTLLEYPRAGHYVGGLVPYYPAAGGGGEGKTPDANQLARADAWPRLLHFLANFAR
jgi:dienelactone hydrolase